MSIKSKAIIIALLLARVASAEPEPDAEEASLPWQLHSVTTANVVQTDSGAAVFQIGPPTVGVSLSSVPPPSVLMVYSVGP